MKVGRNDPCPCGSGRKYKHCCYDKDLEERQASAAAAHEAAEKAKEEVPETGHDEEGKPTVHDTLVMEEKNRVHDTRRTGSKGPDTRPRVQRGAQRGG